jgi:hypothetical protein
MWRSETIHYAPARSRSSRTAERLGERARRRRRWERQMIDVVRAARFNLRLELAVERERRKQIEAEQVHRCY